MRVVLDHVGIAVKDLAAALAFYRDVLGLEVEAPEEIGSQQVRAHFIPLGGENPQGAAPGGVGAPGVKLELLEATSPESPIARYLGKRGPGLHHITLRVDDLRGAVDRLKAQGLRMIDDEPKPGAEGSMIAFVHPAAAHGVLVELKEPRAAISEPQVGSAKGPAAREATRYTLGDIELLSVSDGFIRFDGGAMFGVVPKPLWSQKAPADGRNRITLAMRPLVVRGARTMIIDAGLGDKEDEKFHDRYGVDRRRNLDHALAEAGLSPEDIDLVLASHLHFDHAGGFTVRDAQGRIKPRFPRAQYVVRRGEWEDAMHPNARNHASYLARNYAPLADAGVLQLVDDDHGLLAHVDLIAQHQMVLIESGGRTAAFVADMMPLTAHLADAWIMGFDLYPLDTLAVKQRFVRDAVDRGVLVFFEHDPDLVAGYIREQGGKRVVEPARGSEEK